MKDEREETEEEKRAGKKKPHYQCCSNMLIEKSENSLSLSACAQTEWFPVNITHMVCYYFVCILPASLFVPRMLCSILNQYGNKVITVKAVRIVDRLIRLRDDT